MKRINNGLIIALSLFFVCEGATERGYPSYDGLDILMEMEGIEPPARGGYTCEGKRPGIKDNDGRARRGGECKKCKPGECHLCCSHSESRLGSEDGRDNYINCMRKCCGCGERGTNDDGQNCAQRLNDSQYYCAWFPVEGCGRIKSGSECLARCESKTSCQTCCETSYIGSHLVEECKRRCSARWGG